jgi:charged multivesicular body protein 5
MFWKKKEPKKEEPVPAPTLGEASSKLEGSLEDLSAKIKTCEEELAKYAKGGLSKDRAMQVLKRKKMLEAQRERMYGMVGVVDQANYVVASAETVKMTVAALKSGLATLKASESVFPDVDEVADVMEELDEFMQDQDELNLLFQQGAGNIMDDGELQKELDALEGELQSTKASEQQQATSSNPSFPAAETKEAQPIVQANTHLVYALVS